MKKREDLKNKPEELKKFNADLEKMQKLCSYVINNVDDLSYKDSFGFGTFSDPADRLKKTVRNLFRVFRNITSGNTKVSGSDVTYMDLFLAEDKNENKNMGLEALYLYEHFNEKLPGTNELGQELLSRNYSKAMETVSNLQEFKDFKNKLKEDETYLMEWILTVPGPIKPKKEVKEEEEEAIRKDNIFTGALDYAAKQFEQGAVQGPKFQFEDKQPEPEVNNEPLTLKAIVEKSKKTDGAQYLEKINRAKQSCEAALNELKNLKDPPKGTGPMLTGKFSTVLNHLFNTFLHELDGGGARYKLTGSNEEPQTVEGTRNALLEIKKLPEILYLYQHLNTPLTKDGNETGMQFIVNCYQKNGESVTTSVKHISGMRDFIAFKNSLKDDMALLEMMGNMVPVKQAEMSKNDNAINEPKPKPLGTKIKDADSYDSFVKSLRDHMEEYSEQLGSLKENAASASYNSLAMSVANFKKELDKGLDGKLIPWKRIETRLSTINYWSNGVQTSESDRKRIELATAIKEYVEVAKNQAKLIEAQTDLSDRETFKNLKDMRQALIERSKQEENEVMSTLCRFLAEDYGKLEKLAIEYYTASRNVITSNGSPESKEAMKQAEIKFGDFKVSDFLERMAIMNDVIRERFLNDKTGGIRESLFTRDPNGMEEKVCNGKAMQKLHGQKSTMQMQLITYRGEHCRTLIEGIRSMPKDDWSMRKGYMLERLEAFSLRIEESQRNIWGKGSQEFRDLQEAVNTCQDKTRRNKDKELEALENLYMAAQRYINSKAGKKLNTNGETRMKIADSVQKYVVTAMSGLGKRALEIETIKRDIATKLRMETANKGAKQKAAAKPAKTGEPMLI